MPTRCTLVRQKMYYISELDLMEDGVQPHNFIMVNGEFLSDHYKMDLADRRSLADQFSWIDVTLFSNENAFKRILTENYFDAVFGGSGLPTREL